MYANHRPITNLKVISKSFHSIETALVKVHNNIVSVIDNQCYVILLLLDLSAAFDTVDHMILLSRLSSRFGINSKALSWFQSYLKSPEQVVSVKGTSSCSTNLQCGVPQGSVLGPILYLLYMSLIGDIVRHFYADNSQLYCSFKLRDQATSVEAIESCLNDIDAQMLANMLMLNREKTELLVIGPKNKITPPIEGIHVAGEYIEVSSNARNIRVTFDTHMNLEKHVMNTCKTAFYHLCNIARIRNCLSQDEPEILVQAFISSKLDFCNALLYGLPQSVLDRLQYVQNRSARLVTKTSKSEHITPVLRRLLWLPIRQ